MRKKLKFKKLLNEYRAHFYELQYTKEILKEWLPEFEAYYRQYCSLNDIDLKALNSKNQKKINHIFQETNKLFKPAPKESRSGEFDSKNLFRQIARRFHPDSVGANHPNVKEYEDVFKRAAQAIENGDWGELFDIADKYDLELTDFDKINQTLVISIERTKKQISDQKTTYAWLLFSCDEDEECKIRVVKQFLNQLFSI